MKSTNGHLDIIFRKKANGKTYLAKQFYKVPLQIMPPHYQDEDGTAFLYLLNPSGGVLQHDRLVSNLLVEKNAKAFVTTPGNTKFYKMDDGHAEIDNYINVEEGGVMEYLPEHNVPFANSVTYQNNEFRLHGDSILIASDLVTAGRVGRGEIFEYEKYSSLTKIYVDDELIAYDKMIMTPGIKELGLTGLLEGYKSNGSMYVFKKNLDTTLIDSIRCIEVNENEIRFGVTMVTESLMIVRFLGNSILDIKECLEKIWSLVRKSLLGKDIVRIRKY